MTSIGGKGGVGDVKISDDTITLYMGFFTYKTVRIWYTNKYTIIKKIYDILNFSNENLI